MSAETLSIKTYSPEELRLLAAEGRLKGRDIDRLINLRPHVARRDRVVGREAFELHASRLPCWTDPLLALQTFLDLVEIHSPSGEEDQVADYLTQRLREIGIHDQERDDFGNLIATLPATASSAPNLLFTAHMDCVYPGDGAPVNPVFCASGEIRTDGANSLGADDKAGITAILSTLRYLKSAPIPRGEVRVLFTVQEEIGYRGIKQVLASILNGIHFVISMDPPVRVERGESAHMAVLHVRPGHPFISEVEAAASDCGLRPQTVASGHRSSSPRTATSAGTPSVSRPWARKSSTFVPAAATPIRPTNT